MRTIVNFANNQRYFVGTQRLILSVNETQKTSNIVCYNNDNLNCPTHQDNPYAFKLYAMKSIGKGSVLWLDSSVELVRDAEDVWSIIERDGFFMEDSGHSVGSWCNDRVLCNFNLSREDACAMPMFSAGFMGINFESEVGVEFFNRWWESMERGDFRGDWSNHRHDMACGSIIANRMGLNKKYTSGGQFFPYVGSGYGEPKETAVGHLVGC